MDAASDALAATYAIREKSRGGYRVRVFEENYDFLSQIFECLETYAERECVVHEALRLSYAECRTHAARLAQHLSKQGNIQPGDRIGLALPNSPEWMLSFIAISSIGAVPALINARAGSDEFNHCLASTQCRLCIHARNDLEEGIDQLSMDALRRIVSGGEEHPLAQTPREPEDEALLMFTSGTTGLPKAACLSHESVLTALKTLQYSGALITKQMADALRMNYETLVCMRPAPVNLLVFPLFHVSGCHAVFLTSLLQGGKIVLMTRWDAEKALELIEREKVTAFPAVPTMYRDLLRVNTRDRFDLSSLSNMSVGGQGTPPALLAEIHEAFPATVMGTGYGMTESNGTVTLMVGSDFIENPRSVGRPVSTIDAEIRDKDGKALPANQVGEIHIKGATLMTGYGGEQASSFDSEGWFATGDLGYLDDEGLLYIIDRKTDMVISGGENIYCAEVERSMDMHPDVRESASFGIPNERLGEKLVAVVVPQPGRQLDEATLLAHCMAHLAKHKVPKQIRVQVDPLPRNASGKIIKRFVGARHASPGSASPTEHAERQSHAAGEP